MKEVNQNQGTGFETFISNLPSQTTLYPKNTAIDLKFFHSKVHRVVHFK